MTKEFLEYNTVRDNAIILANKMIDDGYVPNVIYVLLRGGAYLGNIISEVYSLKLKNAANIAYAAVMAKSYVGMSQNSNVNIEGWTLDPRNLPKNSQILLVDDIFDSGNTINTITNYLLETGLSREQIKIAVHDYKIKKYSPSQMAHPHRPDYYCRRHIIERPEDEIWIHYLSHELKDLTDEEKELWYYKKNPLLSHSLDD